VLSELLAAEAGGSAGTPGVLGAGDPGAGWLDPDGGRRGLGQGGLVHTVRENVEAVETVSLRTDADLDAFVKRLLRLFENPQRRDALRAGRLRFRLGGAGGAGGGAGAVPGGGGGGPGVGAARSPGGQGGGDRGDGPPGGRGRAAAGA